MTDAAELIAGDDLKAAALRYTDEMRTKIGTEQQGLRSIFDSWFTRVLTRLIEFDPARSWEDSVSDNAARFPAQAESLRWDLLRMRLFLDRWRQGRFVEFTRRERSGRHYHPRFGTEFGVDVLLTCQGAPSLMRWRGTPLMKNVFDFAMYPALIAELRPRTVFEIGSGLGASAAWFADNMTFSGVDGRVYSVDLSKAAVEHPLVVTFYQGDCANPETLFDDGPPALGAASVACGRRRPSQCRGRAGALPPIHEAGRLSGRRRQRREARDDLRAFTGAHPGCYLVDTRFTDAFGRNATCAADSIFIRTSPEKAALAGDRPA